MKIFKNAFERRRARIRTRIRNQSYGRPRLTVSRSNQHIYAQIIDDENSVTLCAASTLEKAFKETGDSGGNKAAAEKVGKLIAERAREKGIEKVVFDRSGYLYHGRVKTLADAARNNGLNF